MPTNIENRNDAKHSTINSALFHETENNSNRTILEDRNIRILMNMFDTPQNYARHVGCLWLLRELIDDAIGDVPNISEHKLFPMLDTINGLIGCLLRHDVHFDNNGRMYTIQDGKQVFI